MRVAVGGARSGTRTEVVALILYICFPVLSLESSMQQSSITTVFCTAMRGYLQSSD